MLRKLAVCAGLVLALTLTGCANTTTTEAGESSVGYDANAKAAATKADCATMKAECAGMKTECHGATTEGTAKDAATKN